MSSKGGTHNNGEKAVQDLLKELKQLEDEDTLMTVDSTKLVSEQKKKTLRALHFLKEKREDSLKGKAYSDGRKK